MLRARTARPCQDPRHRRIRGARHGRRARGPHGGRPAPAHGDRPNSDAGAQSLDQDAAHADRAGTPRGLLCRPDHRGRDRGRPLPGGGRRRGGAGRFRDPAGGERLSRLPRDPGAVCAHSDLATNIAAVVPDDLWRRRLCICARGTCVRGGAVAPSRRRHDARRARRAGQLRSGQRRVDGMVGDADAAPLPRHAGRSARARPRTPSA